MPERPILFAYDGSEPAREARNALIERHIPLARKLALRYRRSAEPLDDLVQVALLGLVKAADRWDPERGLAFSSFAVPTILGELRRYFRDATWTVRPPRALQELSLAVDRARDSLEGSLGRDATVADLAGRLGRSPEEVGEALQAAEGRWGRSLDAPVNDDEDDSATVGELIGSDDRGYDRAEARATIERLALVLDARAREMLCLRFEDDMLQSEIATRFGVSQMRVSRSIRASLDTLSAHASDELAAAA